MSIIFAIKHQSLWAASPFSPRRSGEMRLSFSVEASCKGRSQDKSRALPKSSPKPTIFTVRGARTVPVAVVSVSPTTSFQSDTISIEACRCRANMRRGFGSSNPFASIPQPLHNPYNESHPSGHWPERGLQKIGTAHPDPRTPRRQRRPLFPQQRRPRFHPRRKLIPTTWKNPWIRFSAWWITATNPSRTWSPWPCSWMDFHLARLLHLDAVPHGWRAGILHPLHQTFRRWPDRTRASGPSLDRRDRMARIDERMFPAPIRPRSKSGKNWPRPTPH